MKIKFGEWCDDQQLQPTMANADQFAHERYLSGRKDAFTLVETELALLRGFARSVANLVGFDGDQNNFTDLLKYVEKSLY